MPESEGASQRIEEQADAIVAEDVARTAATGRLKKRIVPRRPALWLPSGAAGMGCLVVVLLLTGSALAVVLGPGVAPPPGQASPTPTASAQVTAPATGTPAATATGTPSAAPTPTPTSPPDSGGPILTDPDPIGDTVTDSGNPVSDPEVDIVKVSIQKVGDRYRVTVEFASGLTLKYSYAVVLDIGHEAGPPHFILSDAVFIWQTHGLPNPELLIGRIDPQTGELIAGEAEGVLITFDQSSGVVVFEFGSDQLPAAADRYRILSYHRASPEAERNRDSTDVITFGGIICGGTCQQ